MIPVRFRSEARDDLLQIQDYFSKFSDDAASHVLFDIERAIGLLRRYPMAGQQVSGRTFRRIVTRQYRFKIAYTYADGMLTILGVHRYQNRER